MSLALAGATVPAADVEEAAPGKEPFAVSLASSTTVPSPVPVPSPTPDTPAPTTPAPTTSAPAEASRSATRRPRRTPRGDVATGRRDGPKSRPAVPAAPSVPGAYRFVSAPDFLNQDVADLTDGGRRAFLDPATGEVANSTNAAYESALATVLSEMRSHGADDLLVAGDLVEGRWGRDDSRAGVFGPVRTDVQRLAATRRAADAYYSAWVERVRRHGLTPFAAVGDHEIGDDPWHRRGDRWVGFKRRHERDFKSLFARHLMRGQDGQHHWADRPSSGQARHTAYAVRLDDDVLLVTLDVFTVGPDGVRVRVDEPQLRWLEGVLRRARRAEVPWVVVQGHTPITGPVRYRNSSNLHYEGGTRSRLWRAMVEGGVDVYLCGETHDQSAAVSDGILQVGHGSLFYRGEASYVVGQATADALVLANHQFRGDVGFSDRLWTTSQTGAPGHISYPTPSVVTGTIRARRTAGGGVAVQERTGVFAPLR